MPPERPARVAGTPSFLVLVALATHSNDRVRAASVASARPWMEERVLGLPSIEIDGAGEHRQGANDFGRMLRQESPRPVEAADGAGLQKLAAEVRNLAAGEQRLQVALLRLEGEVKSSALLEQDRQPEGSPSSASTTFDDQPHSPEEGNLPAASADDQQQTSEAGEEKKASKAGCKVPLHADPVIGSIFGAAESLCADGKMVLLDGDACETACPQFYKYPIPDKVSCSCDESGEACTLSPASTEGDLPPVMVTYVRCNTSFWRVALTTWTLITVCIVMPIVAAYIGMKAQSQPPAADPTEGACDANAEEQVVQQQGEPGMQPEQPAAAPEQQQVGEKQEQDTPAAAVPEAAAPVSEPSGQG